MDAVTYPCGTAASYTAGCRCADCREARRLHQADYSRRRAKARGKRLTVDAGPVRRHVKRLSQKGVGYKTVAELAGCSPTSIRRLLGMESRSLFAEGPTKRMRRELADRILAVTVDDATGGQKIPAGPTWELLDRLISRGWPKVRLAELIHGPQAVSLQISRNLVWASTAAKVREVYEELRYQRPVGHRSRWDSEPSIVPTGGESLGRLSCRVCGAPLSKHRLDESCREDPYEVPA